MFFVITGLATRKNIREPRGQNHPPNGANRLDTGFYDHFAHNLTLEIPTKVLKSSAHSLDYWTVNRLGIEQNG